MKNISLVVLTLGLFAACGNDDDSSGPIIIPDVSIPEAITIRETGLYPEGIDFNNINNQFIIGSIVRSEVGSVNPQTGVYTTLITDPRLASVTGVFTDEVRNRLLVTSGNLGFSANSEDNATALSFLGIYNLETGALIKNRNLAGLLPEGATSFGNDIAVDDQGNIYVTDSFSPVIYKVEVDTFSSSIFLMSEADFTPAPMGFGLNGIVFNDGNLIVNKTDDGALFKIPVTDPMSYTKIDAPVFVGADGLEVLEDGTIVLIENALGSNPGAHTLSSTDNWETATVDSYFPVPAEKFPATAALANDGEAYVLNAYLGLALEGDLTQETFSILKIN